MKIWIMFAALTALSDAQSSIEAPRLGGMVDAQGALRAVSGVAGNFLVGSAEAHGVIALACARQVCIAKTDSSLVTPHGEIAAPTGAAVLATDGKRAMAYLAETGELLRWSIGERLREPERLAWNNNGGEVLSIRLAPASAEIAVRRDGSVWIVSPDGSVLDALPYEASGPGLLMDGGAVYATEDAVVLRHPDGSEKRFPVAGMRSLYAMSPDWAEIATADGLYALRTTPGQESLYRLPGGAE